MEQVIIGGRYDLLHLTNTEYSSVNGGYIWQSDANKDKTIAQVISTPGKLKNLRVELDGVPGTGTYTFTLHRAVGVGAWANTALTCTVAAGDTIASDTVNEISVAAGDVILLECNPDAPDNARYAQWTIMFEGDNANESLLLGAAWCSLASSWYGEITGFESATNELNMRQVIPAAGTIKNLYAQLDVDPGTAPDAYRITLRLGNAGNGYTLADTALTVTITADNRTGNDTGNSVNVVAGDIVTILVEPLNSPSTNVYIAMGMTFVADTDGESLILGRSLDLDDTATEYEHLQSNTPTWNATEAQRYQLAQACVFKKLYMLLSGSPGAGKNYTFTVRLEGASPGGGLVVIIADAATTGNDTSNEITVSDGEVVNMMVAPTGTPTVRDVYWGLVGYISTAIELSLTDALNLGDTPATQVILNATSTDALNLGDTPATQVILNATSTDALNLGDTPTITLTLSLSLTDAIALSDASAIGLVFTLSVTDALSLSDETAIIKVWDEVLTDVMTLTDLPIYTRKSTKGLQIFIGRDLSTFTTRDLTGDDEWRRLQ